MLSHELPMIVSIIFILSKGVIFAYFPLNEFSMDMVTYCDCAH